MQVHYIGELARLASDLGGQSSACSPDTRIRPFDLTRQRRLIVDSLREASRRAADLGVTIGVQNHHDIGVGYESLYDLITSR